MSNLPNTSRSNTQIKLGLQQSPPTSIYASSSNPSQQILSNSNGNQNVVVGKPNMTSPPIVSKTTTLSLISSSGFAASNAGRDSSIYSMPSAQHLQPINNPTSAVLGMLTSASSNSRQPQNQQSPSNPLQQQMNFVVSGNPVGTSVEQLQVGRRASYSGGSSGGSSYNKKSK